MASILVVDDESTICWGIQRLGERIGHVVHVASSAEAGLELVASRPVDLILLDVRLPGMDGLTAIEHFRRRLPGVPVIVMTAFGDLTTAVRALGSGAADYLLKPFDLSEIRSAIRRALDPLTMAPAPIQVQVGGFVGSSPVMQGVYKRLVLAARSDASVLLVGEPGVGKDLAARTIHAQGRLRGGPFVTADFPTLRAGQSDDTSIVDIDNLLQQARGGTLYLDEVARVPLALQNTLVRALESNAALASEVRMIAATAHDLQQRLDEGTLRTDFYFRVSAFPISIPPLRERGDDIILLAQHFGNGSPANHMPLSAAFATELRSRPWYGNIDELRSALAHAVVLAHGGSLEPEHLPAVQEPTGGAQHASVANLDAALAQLASELSTDSHSFGTVYERYLAAVEAPLLREVITRHGGEVAPAARELGLHRTTLRRKLDQLGIDPRGMAD